MAFATYTAVVIDIIVAVAGLALAKSTFYRGADGPETSKPTEPLVPKGAWPILITIGISGATALAAEAVWTRLLSLLLGATTYTFSLILAAFLIGLGAGSTAGAAIARNSKNPRFALGVCQLLLTVTISWATYAMASQLPYSPASPGFANKPT